MLHGPKQTQNRAKKLRRQLTLPEVPLWQQLRKRPGNLRFRRQHPAGPYVLDFFCPAQRLAIEVDGEIHNRGNQPARDETRDAWLVTQGVQVIRIPARDALHNLDAVLRHIEATTFAKPYPSTSFAGPPSPSGEER